MADLCWQVSGSNRKMAFEKSPFSWMTPNEMGKWFSFVCYRECFFNAATFVPLQIQDARNHVNQAIYLLMNRDVNYHFKTGSEVLKVRRKAL